MSEVAFFILGDFPASIHKHDEAGHLCGYLGVPKGHPWYGRDYDSIDAEVHGGLTYSEHEIRGGGSNPFVPKEALIRPYPHDTAQDTYWIGFDCAHAGDLMPRTDALLPLHLQGSGVYRDESYVRQELEHLASQAAAAWQAVQLGNR